MQNHFIESNSKEFWFGIILDKSALKLKSGLEKTSILSLHSYKIENVEN